MTTASLVRLRPVLASDRARVFQWRNDPVSVNNSRTGSAVTPKEHSAWFAQRPETYWIAVSAASGVPVGSFRGSKTVSGDYVASIIVAPSERGHGYGGSMIVEGTLRLVTAFGAQHVLAVIRVTNAPSLRAFLGAHYKWVGISHDREWVTLRWEGK